MNTNRTSQPRSTNALRTAFTLVEVLVVIVIGLIILTISVPVFQTIIDSSDRSLAINSLQTAVQAAQDIALEGREGEDGAIVFLVDDNGRLSMIPAVKIGTYREPYLAPPGDLGSQSFDYDYVVMEVFSPLDSGSSIQLPESWFVRGYASVGSMIDRFVPADINGGRSIAIWYNSPLYGGSDVNSAIKDEGHWVFPETNLFAKDAQHVGGDPVTGNLGAMQSQFRSPRQSFMIRFDGRTGELSRSTAPALFIDPRLSRERPFGDQPAIEDQWKRVDLSESTRRWGIRMLSVADTDSNGSPWTNGDQFTRSLWLGNISHDTVLVKSVTRIALYNEQDLARDLGARGLNQVTGTLYKDYDQSDSQSEIEFDFDLWPTNTPDAQQLLTAIDRWIQGDTGGPFVNGRPWPDGVIRFTDDTDPDSAAEFDEPRSRLYLIQPYSGKLQEVMR